MRLKKSRSNKTATIAARCLQEEWNRAQQKANIYTEGNLSEWVLFAALNYVPGKEDFEEEPTKKKGRK